MAKFEIAYTQFIEPNEGGYANVESDKGGETYAGISRVYNPTWPGWVLIDMYKSHFAENTIPRNHKFPDLQNLVEEFYFTKWLKNHFEKIHNQDIANLLFDYFVHSGSHAIKAIQKLTGAKQDGYMGPETVAAINEYPNPARLHDNLKAQRESFLQSLIDADPSQAKFAGGWGKRIAGFPDLLPKGGIAIILVLLIVLLLT